MVQAGDGSSPSALELSVHPEAQQLLTPPPGESFSDPTQSPPSPLPPPLTPMGCLWGL